MRDEKRIGGYHNKIVKNKSKEPIGYHVEANHERHIKPVRWCTKCNPQLLKD